MNVTTELNLGLPDKSPARVLKHSEIVLSTMQRRSRHTPRLSHVTPIPLKSQRFVQEREKFLAISFGSLSRDIVQAHLLAV
jgi:hypothetical protein